MGLLEAARLAPDLLALNSAGLIHLRRSRMADVLGSAQLCCTSAVRRII